MWHIQGVPRDKYVSDSFDLIEKEFYELRDFVLNDLDLLINLPKGSNYTAALLVATACEVLGRLRYESGKGDEFFKNYLVPENWRPVASTIFDALRNGLAHSFATKVIVQIPGKELNLGISWKEKPHFVYDAKESCVYLNVRNLSYALRHAFEQYETELRTDTNLCELFRKRRRKKMTINVRNDAERQEWERLLSHD
jgi:hypothetical protein